MNNYDPNRKPIIKAMALIQSIYPEYGFVRDPDGSPQGGYDDGQVYASLGHVLTILNEEVRPDSYEIHAAREELGLE